MPSTQHTPEPAVFRSEKGAINGVASLDSNGLVPNSQLPGATQSAAGTMSAADKTKLDGIATGATAVTIIDNLTTDDATKALSAKQGKALNDQIGTYSDNVTYTTLSAITSMLTTVASTLVVNQTKNIRIHTGTDTNLSPFTAWNDFSGYMTKYSAAYWACFFVGIDGQDVEVGCNNGTITCRSLNTQITSCIAAEWKNSTSGITIAAGMTADCQITVTKQGYTFIGVIGWIINTGGSSVCTHVRVYDANTALVRLYNPTSSQITTSTIQVRCLYVKTDSGMLA